MMWCFSFVYILSGMCKKQNVEGNNVDKEKFFSGLWIIIGLILGSLFTNFVYQDYLAYGGQVRSLVLNNQKLYSASSSLFFYIIFKRGKQYAILCLAGYLLRPWFFLYGFTFSLAFFLGSMLSLQIIQMGMKGLCLALISLFPHFICYIISIILVIKRNFKKEEEILCENRDSFFLKYSILFEIIFMILGCILESFVNPSLMAGILKLWK